jgi:hypothetical protein
MKGEGQKRGQNFLRTESRGLGRKLKPSGTFPAVQCNFKEEQTDGNRVRCGRTAQYANVKWKTMFGTSTGQFCEEHYLKVRSVLD